MKTTITLIKADIGSIGGHVRPSKEVMAAIKDFVGKSHPERPGSFRILCCHN